MKIKTRNKKSYFEVYLGKGFWCLQRWIRHLLWLFGLEFVLEDILQYTLGSDFDTLNVESDILFDLFV